MLVLVCLLFGLFVLPASAAPALNKTKVTAYTGKTVKLKVQNTTKKVTWTSSNTSVATVSAKGVVTGKRVGTAVITAKVGTKKLTCKVTVQKSVLKVDKTSVTIKRNTDGDKIKVIFTPNKSGRVEYFNDNANVIRCVWEQTANSTRYLYIYPRMSGNCKIKITNTVTKESYIIKVTVVE